MGLLELNSLLYFLVIQLGESWNLDAGKKTVSQVIVDLNLLQNVLRSGL